MDIDLGRELGSQMADGANKELHYADLEHFQKQAVKEKPEETPRSQEEPVGGCTCLVLCIDGLCTEHVHV